MLCRFIVVASLLCVRAVLLPTLFRTAMRLASSSVDAAVLPCRHSVARRGDRIGRRMSNSRLSVLFVAAQLLLLSPASGRPKALAETFGRFRGGYRRLTSLRWARLSPSI